MECKKLGLSIESGWTGTRTEWGGAPWGETAEKGKKEKS